jgi:hypothetical protein
MSKHNKMEIKARLFAGIKELFTYVNINNGDYCEMLISAKLKNRLGPFQENVLFRHLTIGMTSNQIYVYGYDPTLNGEEYIPSGMQMGASDVIPWYNLQDLLDIHVDFTPKTIKEKAI